MGLLRGLNLIALSLIAIFIAYLNYFTNYSQGYELLLTKLFHSVVIILVFYAIKAIIEDIVIVRVRDTKERYTFRKAVSIIITFLAIASLIAVWFRETTGLIVAYGILSAGIVIALQDLLKSMAGGMIIFVSRPFRAGDRIEVDDVIGDVLDIRSFSTSIMEIEEWVDGDQYTGRIVQLPNSFVLSGKVKNYTKDFSFIWDEVQIMLIYGSNWKKAEEIALLVAKETLHGFEESSKEELLSMGEKYFITTYDVETKLYMKIRDNWIDMRLRYVVDPRQRRKIRNKLTQQLLKAFEQEEDINVGTATSIDILESSRITLDKP
ncbi:small-conductance mechanosensitive channel [Methanohalophilus levihalophilus]|uniref:mechanosensitive ion channel family protein n=1 Tax=Methanohalophilus levihalophilus TaxID=1431282 RepID=UPI001AEA5688|nr:mechanosensitive ion channel domain-containing protein [Methanohalophilus levihalophilus]MBP2030404.1 small-conductance mechanosensitive channel [Methanohalophilus levihalophilus]